MAVMEEPRLRPWGLRLNKVETRDSAEACYQIVVGGRYGGTLRHFVGTHSESHRIVAIFKKSRTFPKVPGSRGCAIGGSGKHSDRRPCRAQDPGYEFEQ
jgi:hypothetical protein